MESGLGEASAGAGTWRRGDTGSPLGVRWCRMNGMNSVDENTHYPVDNIDDDMQ